MTTKAIAPSNWRPKRRGRDTRMLFSLIHFFESLCINDTPHNYVIPQAMPHAIPQTYSVFYAHRFPPLNDVWETSAEIPYWWRVTTQIWVVLLIGWIKFPTRPDQSEALPRSGQWRVISMEFLRSFLRRHLAGKPVVASRNVGCFLTLKQSNNFNKCKLTK